MTTLASLRGSMVLGLLLGSAGCAASPSEDDASVGAAGAELGYAQPVANPSGAYTAKVTLNGTGCRAGSWDALINHDGKELTLEVLDYETNLDRGVATTVRDCTIALDLGTDKPATFALTRLRHGGYLYLDQEGMTRKDRFTHGFAGQPQSSTDFTLPGPVEEPFEWSKNFTEGERPTSRCGTEHRLNLFARAMLRNNPAKTGSGYTGLLGCDSESAQASFKLTFDWQPCNAAPAPSVSASR